jgi:circadian clock protein KaiC
LVSRQSYWRRPRMRARRSGECDAGRVTSAQLEIRDMSAANETRAETLRDATGIEGLDDILGGGLPKHRLYLTKGSPGVGKTTMALTFLREGVRRGERVLYITLSETKDEVLQVAHSHGWSLEGVSLFELSSAEQTMRLDDENTLYAPADIDLKETMRVLLDEVERIKPHRVVFDSLSEIRLLAQSPLRYRRELLSLKQHFAGRPCTVLLLDDRIDDNQDLQVESLVHGVVILEQIAVGYGADRRRLRIGKLRGSPFRSGYHDFVVRTGGLVVFPRLMAFEHRTENTAQPASSGIAELDALLGGGIDRATATLLTGPAGTGKSVIATLFACAAAQRGEPAALFLFEERIGTLRRRAHLLGLPLDKFIENGLIRTHQIDPAELAPDEFTRLVRDAVERDHARIIVIDSINGYFTAMPEARFLSLHMHELLSYLAERGVATVLTMAQTGILGSNMASPVDVSYLADTVILLRYYEVEARLQKAISILKKRSGFHQDTIHKLEFGPKGLRVGQALTSMRGVMTGSPIPTGGPIGEMHTRERE